MLFMFVVFLLSLCICTSNDQNIRHILQTTPAVSIQKSYLLNDCSVYQMYTAYTYFWHRCLIRVILFFSLNSSIVHIIYSCNLSHCVVVKCTLHIYIYLYVRWHQLCVCVCVRACVRARVCVFCLLFSSTCFLTQPIRVNCFIVGLSFLIVCVCLVYVMCALLSIPSFRNSTYGCTCLFLSTIICNV